MIICVWELITTRIFLKKLYCHHRRHEYKNNQVVELEHNNQNNKIMTERPSRGPRRDYAPVAGSEDDSNHGNDSNNESEFESQSSIGSESSIDYQDDDNDDHKGTGGRD